MKDKTSRAGEITEGLRDWSDNQRDDSSDALLKLVYAELHRQAHRYLKKERAGHTLKLLLWFMRLISNYRTKISRLGKPLALFRHCRDDDAADFD